MKEEKTMCQRLSIERFITVAAGAFKMTMRFFLLFYHQRLMSLLI